MGRALQGYMTKSSLTDWHGKSLGWKLHRKVTSFTVPPEYDTTYAVILVKEGKRSVAYAAGYSLGEGMLFRGSVVGSAKWGTRADADLVREAEEVAVSESEYWMDKDQEAYEEDLRQQQLEEELYERDPRRPRRRKRKRVAKRVVRRRHKTKARRKTK